LCRMLEVSRAGYYAWRRRPVSAREQRRVELTARIHAAHQDSRGTYGSPRITVELKAAGVAVSENTVAKYMRAGDIRVRRRRRFVPRTTDSDHAHPIAPNRLDRDFAAPRPNQKWAADLTYIWTDQGWLYLSVLLDLCSRRVVGWSMNQNLRAEGAIDALSMAVRRRKLKAGRSKLAANGKLLHHSDRGVQYACDQYRLALDDLHIASSMSRPGNCYDNAVVESFFGTFKSELVNRVRYRTHQEARASVCEWIECWYNRARRHSSLDYLSPEQFEAQLN